MEPSVSDRECGDCGLCCKVLAVDEIDKPAHEWCGHFVPKHGCGIYATRPTACATFRCLWLRQEDLGPEWQPNKAKFVLYFDADGTQLVVNVDPAHAGAWRKEPFRSALGDWARLGLETGVQVVVKIKRRVIAVMPDREVDLGDVADDERIRFTRVTTEAGIELMAQKLPRNG